MKEGLLFAIGVLETYVKINNQLKSLFDKDNEKEKELYEFYKISAGAFNTAVGSLRFELNRINNKTEGVKSMDQEQTRDLLKFNPETEQLKIITNVDEVETNYCPQVFTDGLSAGIRLCYNKKMNVEEIRDQLVLRYVQRYIQLDKAIKAVRENGATPAIINSRESLKDLNYELKKEIRILSYRIEKLEKRNKVLHGQVKELKRAKVTKVTKKKNIKK